ncbi:MAG: 16S rRNA (cytidine(1402)-2'-O)-methyltransferase [Candidatus Aureabacteria bacterium]|nr:16S rRNA (cytidine(1402)-2'-O)-methyltransferase [Candidatus Auribacterota bacterium]
MKMPVLYVVATPIGNMGDITPRAVEILRDSGLIIAEDTRTAGLLLERFNIPQKKAVSFFEGNEIKKLGYIAREIETAGKAALITEAGTPCISDPGYRLVSMLRKKGVDVIPVPGPCAAITALSASGIPSDRFAFEGYLPKNDKKLREFLSALKWERRTLVFYESPRRIRRSLEVMSGIFGGREACLFREMTKVYEESIFAPLSGILEKLQPEPRGEITLVVSGCVETQKTDYDFEKIVSLIREEAGISASKAAKIAAKITGLKKRDIYRVTAEKG